MLITAACLIIMVIAANAVLFKTSSSDLNDAIDTIRAHQTAAAGVAETGDASLR
jgi:hypothetical protein